MVQCYIQRRKNGLARLFPTYEIYLKDGDQFLLAARKRKKNKSSNYLISLDKDDLARQSGNFFGKLRSNFIGTEFVLYDKGTNPEKLDDAQKDSALIQARQELGTVLYKQNVLGSRGPRKMKVMVPRVDAEGQRRVLKPTSPQESMLERYKVLKDDPDVMVLKNKPPKWNDQVGAYVLNFNGRVTRASVKNFQLSDPKGDRAPRTHTRPHDAHARRRATHARARTCARVIAALTLGACSPRRSRRSSDAVWPRGQGCIHHGLSVPSLRVASVWHRAVFIRLQDCLRVRRWPGYAHDGKRRFSPQRRVRSSIMPCVTGGVCMPRAAPLPSPFSWSSPRRRTTISCCTLVGWWPLFYFSSHIL